MGMQPNIPTDGGIQLAARRARSAEMEELAGNLPLLEDLRRPHHHVIELADEDENSQNVNVQFFISL